jgi:hypothetical protein
LRWKKKAVDVRTGLTQDLEMATNLDIPTYQKPKSEVVNETVAKSIAKPNAWAKPGTMSNAKTHVRTMSVKPGRQRRKKHDPRNITFY